jgi:hypothetical protein
MIIFIEEVKKMKALVYDFGLCIEHSRALIGDKIDTVYYYVPWQDAFPRFLNALIGRGYEDEGLIRIERFWDYIDKVDLIVVFDTYLGDLVHFLREKGYLVFGAGQEEILENDRYYAKKLQKKLGLPTQDFERIIGFEKLKQYLKENKNKVVKLNTYRGSLETFTHIDYKSSEPLLEHLEVELSVAKNYVEFLVEDFVGVIEPGTDFYVVDGEYPDKVLWGYEKKGSGYVAKIENYDNIPKALKDITDAYKKVFNQYKARTFYSTEIRVDEKGRGYLIDNCVRCFDEQTEVLTDKGWKYFKDLNGTEQIATLNPETLEIEYHKPYAYQKYWYEGEMIQLSSPKKAIDLLITPDHMVWGFAKTHTTGGKRVWGKLKPYLASDLPYILKIPRTGVWKGKKIEYFVLPEYKKEWVSGHKWNSTPEGSIKKIYHLPALAIKMENWLKFFGLYLAEGSCSANNTACDIAQSKTSKRRKEIEEILNSLPFKWSVAKNGAYRISSVQLVNYLKPFGKCYQKYVPDFIKGLTPELIKCFLYGFWLGDGSKKNKSKIYFTTSRQLADDIQELIFKTGEVANVYERKVKGTKMSVKGGKTYIRNHNQYVITTKPTKKCFYFEKRIRRKNQQYIKKVNYKGYVYDVTVPNHIIYVRRNGIPIWSGNCPMPSPSACEMIAFKNWDEIIIEGAKGNLVNPVIDEDVKYLASVSLESDWADNHWLAIEIPEEYRQFIKFRKHLKDGDKYYAIPGFSSICAVVGYGRTLDEAIDMVVKIAEQVKAYQIEYNFTGLQQIKEDIEKGEKLGLKFY